MARNVKLQILEEILGDFYLSRDEVLFYCPKCKHHNRKFSVNLDKDVFKCWVCAYQGRSIYKIVKNYGNSMQVSAWKQFQPIKEAIDIDNLFVEEVELLPQTFQLPEEFVSLTAKKLPISSIEAKQYLKSRGISKQDMIDWKMGYCSRGEYANRIVVPSFNSNGDCNFFIGRSYSKDTWPPYHNPNVSAKNIIFNELFVDFDEPIMLVEGVFDAVKSGSNAIPLLGSNLKEDFALFRKIINHDSTVYLALDNDAKKKEKKIVKLLRQYDIKTFVVELPPGQDPGNLTKAQMQALKNNAILMNDANYLEYELGV